MGDEPRRQINFRLSEQDVARLGTLTEHYALERSALIRMLLKRECDSIEGKKKT